MTDAASPVQSTTQAPAEPDFQPVVRAQAVGFSKDSSRADAPGGCDASAASTSKPSMQARKGGGEGI